MPAAYRLLMRGLYGPAYRERLVRAAAWVRKGDRVIDLFAGDGSLHEFALRGRETIYTAVDMSPHFIAHLRSKGLNAVQADVRTWIIPPCDVITCLTSLYQCPGILPGLVDQARNLKADLVILEPVENVAQSRLGVFRRIAAHLTDFGEGPVTFRFTEADLRDRFEACGATHIQRLGRDLLGAWNFREPRS